jgi:seryl-tRNA synthetase
MASLKDSFAKGITTINMKTNSFMEESKCKTYISNLEAEIREQKNQIGEIVYQKWSQEEDYTQSIETVLNSIKEKYEEIEVQKQKIEQVRKEEQQVLGSSANTMQQNAPVQPQGNMIFCSKCGSQTFDNFKFCSKCGAPLN